MKQKSYPFCVFLFALTLLTSSISFAAVPQQIDLSALTGRVVTINDPEYHAARLSWNLYFSRYPLAIVYAQNKHDVRNALNFCRKNEIPFRIRSGGHSFEGWSSLDSGIMIDVSEMNNIEVDTKKRLAFVQPGAKQGEVVLALGEFGLALPTGLENSPGISGVCLGGGIGLLIRQYGLNCDHLKEVEIITANGKILRASKHKHRDLFFACQGSGGGNFGIVTELVYSVFPVGDVTMYQIFYPYEVLETLVSRWQEWAPFQTKRLNSVMSLNPNKNQANTHTVFGIFDGSQEELLDLLTPLLTIPQSNLTTLQTLPYVDSFKFFAEFPSPPTKAKISSAFAYKLLPKKAIRSMKSALDNPVNSHANIFFLAWGGEMRKTPPNATAFWNRKALYFLEWEESWTNDQEAGPSIIWVQNLRAALQPFIKGSYVNVPDFDIVDWGKEYFGKNFKKLKKIKAKYDPDNVFTFELQAIPPNKKWNSQ